MTIYVNLARPGSVEENDEETLTAIKNSIFKTHGSCGFTQKSLRILFRDFNIGVSTAAAAAVRARHDRQEEAQMAIARNKTAHPKKHVDCCTQHQQLIKQ